MKIASFERMTQLLISGKEQEAEKESQNMITENPSHYAGYLCLAYVYAETNQNLDLATNYIEQALSYNQNIVENYVVGIAIYEQLHKPKRVTELARFGLTLDHSQAKFYEALAENGSGGLVEKIALYEKALFYAPNNTSYMGILSEAIFNQNPRNLRALELENLAFATKPDDIDNLNRFAKMNYARGDFKKALQYSERALCLAPDREDSRELYEEVELAQNPFFGTYEKVRLYTHRVPISVTILIVLAYVLLFMWALNSVGYLAVVMWIIPLGILIVAILVQTGTRQKETMQAKQNRYVRLPIAIIALIILFIPAGIQVVHLALDAVKQEVAVPKRQMMVQSHAEKKMRVANTSENATFSADYDRVLALRKLLENGKQNDVALLEYVARSYLPTFKQKIADAKNYHAFMNFKFYQMFALDGAEKAYLTQENNQFDLIVLLEDGKISHVYGDSWTTDKKEKLAMEGMMPHIVADGKYTEIYE
ncbi:MULTISPECIES: lipopolysaccharide assembly protein LapB [Listeria]|uniref:tetratricopeptide repeat protein n=1 Tax=Listeria TaxID=1637 RepID=UPI000B59582C|nr:MULTISPECIES: hypothetical protein [Listeria]